MATPRAKRNRRVIIPAQQTQPPLVGWTFIVDSTSTVQVTFSEPIQVAGLPQWTTTTVGPVGAFVEINPTTWEAYFSTDFPEGEVITVGPYDPGIRTSMGGYMSPGTMEVGPTMVNARKASTAVAAAAKPAAIEQPATSTRGKTPADPGKPSSTKLGRGDLRRLGKKLRQAKH